MIILFGFTLAYSDVGFVSRNLSELGNIEIFLSLSNWLYIINKNSNVFVKYVFYFTCEVENMYISFVASPLMKYKYFPLHSVK